VEDRFLAEGELWQPITMHNVVPGRRPVITLDFSELAGEADRPGMLILEQSETERLLLEAVRESGLCEVTFQAEAIALEQDANGARLTIREEEADRSLHADCVVGCDGASSFVREALGLPFEGMTYSLRPMLADIEVEDERDALPQPRAWTGRGGYTFATRLRPGLWRIVRLQRGEPEKEEVPDEEVSEWRERLLGPGPARVVWASRFRIHVRSSPRFRVGRILLAGDAAHVHDAVVLAAGREDGPLFVDQQRVVSTQSEPAHGDLPEHRTLR
jgi:2-polyprenyl-6-methoxyphenol hydroxylase-like FAD-dependent oxidoreductase